MADARWVIAGEIIRRSFLSMDRRGVDDYPVHVDWPPRVGSGTAPPGPSRAIRRMLQRQDILRAIGELRWRDNDAWLAVKIVDVDHEGYKVAEAKLNLARRTIQEIIHDRAWPFIAEWALREEAERS